MMSMRTFWVVWAGQLVSQVGTAMTGFAMTIWVYQETGSVTRLGFMLLAVSLPGIVMAPTAGVLVDRINRRVVMLAADSVAGLGSLTLAMLFFSNSLIYWQILVVVAASSAASSFQEPAYRAAIPTIVPTEHLGRANGLSELGPAVGTLIAPAIAGGLLLTVGLGAVLAVDFITFTVAVATLLVVRFPDVTEAGGTRARSVYREFLDGFDYLRERRGLLGFLLIAAALNFVLTFANVLWVPVFLAFMNEGALGVTMSAIGAAMVVGSVVMGAWGGPKQRVRGMLGFMAIGGVGLIVAGLRPDPLIAVGGAVMLMAVVPIVNGTSQTLWQTKIAPAIQGRVFSTRRMVAQIATPIAFVSAGPLADNVFEPLLMPDGALAGSLGQIWDTGTGRGSALAISCVGVAIIVIAAVAWMTPSIRNIERDIPDALPQLETLELG